MRIVNRKARFDYEVIEEYEAGIVLYGYEVKAVKTGRVSLAGSRAVFRGEELWLVGMRVELYEFARVADYVPDRSRKLLLSKKEIVSLREKKKSLGLTLIPLAVYNRGSLIKVGLGLVRGKKKYEKREKIKQRDEQRKIARLLK